MPKHTVQIREQIEEMARKARAEAEMLERAAAALRGPRRRRRRKQSG